MMIQKEVIRNCLQVPMDEYHQKMVSNIGNWRVLVDASKKILSGEKVDEAQYPDFFSANIKMMNLIMEKTSESTWDWSDPAIQGAYKEIADSAAYKMFEETTIALVAAILKKVSVGTLLEVGTGPGHLTEALCSDMTHNNISVPIIVSDRAAAVEQTAERLRGAFPHLTIHDFVWDVKNDAPSRLLAKCKKPVLLYERFSIPYGGYDSINRIAPVADIMIMNEDLNLTGEEEAFDIIYGKIGAQFFTFSETEKYLKQHFSFVYSCDEKTVKTIDAPVANFILAMK